MKYNRRILCRKEYMPKFEFEMASDPVKEKYAEHVSKFKCHIPDCTNVSAGPKYIHTHEATAADLEGLDPYSSYDGIWEADWNIPTNLYMCEGCNLWTCPTHMRSKEACLECKEKLTVGNVNDAIVGSRIADEINELFNTGSNRLTSIKVCINPKYHKANIYAGYEDTARLLESGSEETMASLCEALIKWPQDELGENTEETWKDLSYAKRQMERAFMLSGKLNQQFIILNYSDDLKCYIENGKAHIERVK
jgi:hypothetical protein